MRPEIRTSWGFVPRLAALYAALFILPGIAMPFFPIWLKAKEVDATLIGVVLAVPMVARALAIPVIAREVDRRDAVRAALVFASLTTFGGYMLVGLSSGVIAIFAAYTLTSLFSTPLMPLAETYALRGLMARKRAYGPVRLWGSFAFIVGNFAAGFAADVIPARHLIWLMVASSALVRWPRLNSPRSLRVARRTPCGRDRAGNRCAVLRLYQCLQQQVSFKRAMRCSMAFRLYNGMPPGLTALSSRRCGRLAWPQRSSCSPCKDGCRHSSRHPYC